MKILFIYTVQKSLIIEKPLKGQEDIQMGIAQLSSVLKNGGHQTDMLVLDRKYKKKNYKLIDQKLRYGRYELVCFSSVYSEFIFVKEIAKYIKRRYNVFLILGGVHVTISPDESYLDIFDALCIGEGENALLELADRLEERMDISSVSNLWIKENGHIIKNKTREFIQDLDSLPFIDRDLWQPLIFDKNTRLTILLGRGCPYNCTYCCNHRIREVAPGKYVRIRSVENIIAEMEYLISKFPDIKEYFLEIETLGADTEWLLAFCDQVYFLNKGLQNKLSFSANLRVYDNLDFDLIFSNLQKANFGSIIIGLESGNERIRKEILNTHYSNEKVIQAVKSARMHNIKVGIFNLVGIPTESLNDFKDTLRLNQEIQPDWHATSIFFPYEGTKLYNFAKEQGLLPEKLNFNEERQHAVLDLPQFSRRQIQKQFDNFHYNVYKTYKNKSMLKTILFLAQKVLGHNFMANAKNRLIVILYRLKIRNNLLNIIQKA
jgi:anaerobic magnesium-protoporphyrin IX monomethyl ester cyclase